MAGTAALTYDEVVMVKSRDDGPELPRAVAEVAAQLDRLEGEVQRLGERLGPISRAGALPSNLADPTPSPEYATPMGDSLGVLQHRIYKTTEALVTFIDRLEV